MKKLIGYKEKASGDWFSGIKAIQGLRFFYPDRYEEYCAAIKARLDNAEILKIQQIEISADKIHLIMESGVLDIPIDKKVNESKQACPESVIHKHRDNSFVFLTYKNKDIEKLNPFLVSLIDQYYSLFTGLAQKEVMPYHTEKEKVLVILAALAKDNQHADLHPAIEETITLLRSKNYIDVKKIKENLAIIIPEISHNGREYRSKHRLEQFIDLLSEQESMAVPFCLSRKVPRETILVENSF